jgi:hypothetical protein
MKRLKAIVWIALLTGCQTLQPSRVVDDGTRTTHTLREEPHRAAVCIASNLDRYPSPYSAQIQPGTGPVLVEVHVRGESLVSVAQLLVFGEGSTALIWIMPQPFYGRDELAAAMVAGC